MSTSKKMRFEVFKRDGFCCAYCGKTPPQVTLEVDHIEPKSKGGSDIIENLVTACFDCNRGKTNIRLDKIPSRLSENLEVLQEKEAQLKEYQKLIRKIEKRKAAECEKINNIFSENYQGRVFTESFIKGSLIYFLKNLPLNEVEEAMYLASTKVPEAGRAISYFCGICHNKIKGVKPWWEKEGEK